MSLPEFSRVSTEIALGFDDVVLEPASTAVTPKDVDLRSRLTKNILLSQPYIVNDADSEMAITAARSGSIGIISHQMAISKQADMVRKVKRFQSHVVRNPISIAAKSSIVEALEVQQRYGLNVVPVTDHGALQGYLVLDDNISYDDVEKTVSDFISSLEVITLPENSEKAEAHEIMQQKNADYIALVDEQNRFTGLITREDKENIEKFPEATMDKSGCLRVVASINATDFLDRVSALIDAGVDAILIDVPQGHSKHISDIITYIRRQRSGHVDVIAGSVVTTEAALSLIDAGADGIKIGRQLPDITAILQVAEACSLHNIPALVGQPTETENISKAFAAGAGLVLLQNSDDKPITETIKTMSANLRHHMSETGCATIKEFNLRPQFIRLR